MSLHCKHGNDAGSCKDCDFENNLKEFKIKNSKSNLAPNNQHPIDCSCNQCFYEQTHPPCKHGNRGLCLSCEDEKLGPECKHGRRIYCKLCEQEIINKK